MCIRLLTSYEKCDCLEIPMKLKSNLSIYVYDMIVICTIEPKRTIEETQKALKVPDAKYKKANLLGVATTYTHPPFLIKSSYWSYLQYMRSSLTVH